MSDKKYTRKEPGRNFKDLVGKTIGEWSILSYAGRMGNTDARHWVCRCSCGVEKPVRENHLNRGQSRDCGHGRKIRLNFTKHNLSKTPEYTIWHAVRVRCYKDRPQHHRYQGRGITVCLRWLESFQSFYDDMGPRPSSQHSIDRIDNDGGYWCGQCDECVAAGRTVSNCRWATPTEQCNNTSVNHLVTIDGRTMNVTQWSTEFGIPAKRVFDRISSGWDPELAIKTPIKKSRPMTGTGH